MDRPGWFVVFAALMCTTDAAVTFDSGKTTQTVEIAEGATAFTSPLTVTAKTDVHSGTVTYAFKPQQTTFTIDAAGAITISGTLDYETTPTYTLKIVATDGSEAAPDNTPTATATVIINVQDVLKFAKDKDSVCVPDGAEAGTEVASVKVADTTDDVTYAITDGNTGNVFSMDGEKIKVASGKITDKETTPSFNLTVTATNNPETATFVWMVKIGNCSAGSIIMIPIGLLTIMVTVVLFMS